MFKNFDNLLISVSPFQSRVSEEATRLYDGFSLLPNHDWLVGSQSNPLASLALLPMCPKQGCSFDHEALSRLTGLDPDYFLDDADVSNIPESQLYEAMGRLINAAMRTWRNQIRENILYPTIGTCDEFEPPIA